jgi:hypothetical protein
MYRACFMLVCGGWLLAGSASAQWLSFENETATRLVLSTVPTNDSQEKDIATGDLNQDGWMDVVVSRKNPFSNPGARTDVLLMNVGGVLTDQTATFAPGFLSTPTDARDLFIGDFTGDGWPDVVVASTFQQQPSFYRNAGDDGSSNWLGLVDESGTRFPFINDGVLQFCAVWGGDVTGDGAMDLYFSNYNEFGTAFDVLLINDGAGVFTNESLARLGTFRNSAFGTSAEIHDVDNDGDQDIIKTSTLNSVPPWNSRGNFILFNDGTGHFPVFQKAPSTNPYMFTVGDLDGNGFLDLYVVDDQQDYVNMVQSVTPDEELQYSTVTLTNARTTSFGGNVKMADLDGDGDLDVGLADVDVDAPPCDSQREFSLMQNTGGVLADPYPTDQPFNTNAYDFAFLDVDNDGLQDLFMGVCAGYMVFTQGDPLPSVTVDVTLNLRSTSGTGSVRYSGTALNTSTEAVTTDLWIEVTGPDSFSDVAFTRTATIPAGGTNRPRGTYIIPSTAPDGVYTFTFFSGTQGGPVDDSDVKTYTKTTAAARAEAAAASLSPAKAGTLAAPEATTLGAAYPNPFNPQTTLSYNIAEEGFVRLEVYNLLGQRVALLAEGHHAAGFYQITWNAGGAPGGAYFFRLVTPTFTATRHMVLLK